MANTEDVRAEKSFIKTANCHINNMKNDISVIDTKGTHSAVQVENDLDVFRNTEEPTQKQRDNLLESLASNTIDMALWSKNQSETGKRLESTLENLKDAISSGICEITKRQDVTNGRINSLQEWRIAKDKLDEEQSKMIAESTKLHQETLSVLGDVNARLKKLKEIDRKLEEEVLELKETDTYFDGVIQKLKNWKLKIVAGAVAVIFLFKYDFVQIPDKYVRNDEQEITEKYIKNKKKP